MNNTKANSLKRGQFLKIAYSGHSCANKIQETALYSLEGPLESNYSKETAKENQKFSTSKA